MIDVARHVKVLLEGEYVAMEVASAVLSPVAAAIAFCAAAEANYRQYAVAAAAAAAAMETANVPSIEAVPAMLLELLMQKCQQQCYKFYGGHMQMIIKPRFGKNTQHTKTQMQALPDDQALSGCRAGVAGHPMLSDSVLDTFKSSRYMHHRKCSNPAHSVL